MANILFFVPHQDDDAITLGAGINNHVNAGHTVHVILATDGIASAIRGQTSLSRTQFTKARDDEFKRSVLALGVAQSNIHISRFTAEDGKLTVARARDIIMEYLEKFPGSPVKTHTNRGAAHGQHPDHYNLGKAALELYNEGKFSDLRLYIEPYEFTEFQAANDGIGRKEITSTPVKVVNALNEYKKVNASLGQYGIGYMSVSTLIDAAISNPVSYNHAP